MNRKASRSQSYGRKSGKGGGKDRKKRKEDSRLSGFTTLSQVVGAPKRHAFHSHIPLPVDRIVKEPFEVCPICGEKIESITTSFTTSDGHHVHFDCVLSQIRDTHPLREGQTISYAGKGNFAIFEKDAEGHWITVERIPYESSENYEKMKSFVEGLKI